MSCKGDNMWSHDTGFSCWRNKTWRSHLYDILCCEATTSVFISLKQGICILSHDTWPSGSPILTWGCSQVSSTSSRLSFLDPCSPSTSSSPPWVTYPSSLKLSCPFVFPFEFKEYSFLFWFFKDFLPGFVEVWLKHTKLHIFKEYSFISFDILIHTTMKPQTFLASPKVSLHLFLTYKSYPQETADLLSLYLICIFPWNHKIFRFFFGGAWLSFSMVLRFFNIVDINSFFFITE